MRLARVLPLLGIVIGLVCVGSSAPSPRIDIALHATFQTPHVLLELLETAAEEVPESYFPLLKTIASGQFQGLSTDRELYDAFVQVLLESEHFSDPASLSSFEFAFSIHSAVPRIESQHQYYNTAVRHLEYGFENSTVSHWKGSHFCMDGECSGPARTSHGGSKHQSARRLPFDRATNPGASSLAWTLYVDITSPEFGQQYTHWLARGESDYRIRYKPSPDAAKGHPVSVSGYGVELALKRTDYIVIDDRQDGENTIDGEIEGTTEVNLEQADAADVKPLSSSELLGIGLKTGSFIMGSDDPLETLDKVLKDFPKHAAALASHKASPDFRREHGANREIFLSPGFNMLLINGAQVEARQVDAFALLEHMRKERKLVGGIQSLGLSAKESIDLLTHPAITEAQSSGEPQRYDYRDFAEGGEVILWLNDIEKDKRYADWPKSISSLLQRTYPGQLPALRKDIHNVILSLDFSNAKDIALLVETVQSLIRRLVPVRFGIVPQSTSEAAVIQSKIVYHLAETYGLAAVMDYLQAILQRRKFSSADNNIFTAAIGERKVRSNRSPQDLQELLVSDSLRTRVAAAGSYMARLGISGNSAPFLCNGVIVARSDEWLQVMSQRLGMDLRSVQKAVYEETLSQISWVPSMFLKHALSKRNPLLIPEDDNMVRIVDVSELQAAHPETFAEATFLHDSEASNSRNRIPLLIVGDLTRATMHTFLIDAIEFALGEQDIALSLVHQQRQSGIDNEAAQIAISRAIGSRETFADSQKASSLAFVKDLFANGQSSALAEDIGISADEVAILLGGRLVVIPITEFLTMDDLDTLFVYERQKRVGPIVAALQALDLSSRLDSAMGLAKLTSQIARSAISDVPEGIFDAPAGPRIKTHQRWADEHTSITVGDVGTAALQMTASIDPVSEVAQRWVPILRVLSKLEGVSLKIYLNPRERLEELPLKRFYRHVLEAKAKFGNDGQRIDSVASFENIPKDTLLTTTLDVPPAWLVAPRESIHDLDNIKLSSLKGYSHISADYELEHILIEGHSKDVSMGGTPPRGVQLVLGTDSETDVASTIVMANLGYFQFKANPGVYHLALQQGRSQKVYQLDGADSEVIGSESAYDMNDIHLTSFQGSTIFPRLSRKPGQENEDVLEETTSTTLSLMSRVSSTTEAADRLLSRIGLTGIKTGDYVEKGVRFGQRLLGRVGSNAAPQTKHADINIFSVASGHLYERMLNIMMVSVMRHTSHTVKFWFIEQFLSPSFKTFLPVVAREYGFEYEMVTYKWPHWLRAQKEKQRTIWGYKILFLDVLFPLDLDKVIFVDADQIVRTDMFELVQHDLEGAPYGFTPMCDSREEMEGFRFWKQGYWKTFLRGLPYHISALYVVDLSRFRAIAAGDRLRQQYHQLSADPGSLSNLDQDLPNHMQMVLPIHSLPQEWLWCETWCSDEALKEARTIDLCNNPLTKEPKLDRARRQVPEWNVYDEEIAALARRAKGVPGKEGVEKGILSAGEVVGRDEL